MVTFSTCFAVLCAAVAGFCVALSTGDRNLGFATFHALMTFLFMALIIREGMK